MAASFDKKYWHDHWRRGLADGSTGAVSMAVAPPHPALADEVVDLTPGSALDVGCGAGAEAMWLAERGWQVTAADIAAPALAVAAERASERDLATITWVQADLTHWSPEVTFDLVMTFYAHPTGPQLAFYERIGSWVSPGGTLLIVGHATDDAQSHDGAAEQRQASVTAAAVAEVLGPAAWQVRTARVRQRHAGGGVGLHDVVVRAIRQR